MDRAFSSMALLLISCLRSSHASQNNMFSSLYSVRRNSRKTFRPAGFLISLSNDWDHIRISSTEGLGLWDEEWKISVCFGLNRFFFFLRKVMFLVPQGVFAKYNEVMELRVKRTRRREKLETIKTHIVSLAAALSTLYQDKQLDFHIHRKNIQILCLDLCILRKIKGNCTDNSCPAVWWRLSSKCWRSKWKFIRYLPAAPQICQIWVPMICLLFFSPQWLCNKTRVICIRLK